VRRASLLLLLGACNAFYGLDETRGRDAFQKEFFDAPPDAPFTCPATGEPVFKFALEHVPIMQCQSYVPSRVWGKALTACEGEIRQGDIDKAVSKATVNSQSLLFDPRLWPEGDRAFFKNPMTNNEEVYKRNTDDSWSFEAVVAPTGMYTDFSAPSRGPDRRAIAISTVIGTGIYTLTEYSDRSGSWQPIDSYPSTDLFAVNAFRPSLTPDGMHLVAEGQAMGGPFKSIIYSSRPNRDSKFGRFTYLASVPLDAQFPYLEENCGRIYFNTVSTVFAQEQL
jgi:hypothetical protein